MTANSGGRTVDDVVRTMRERLDAMPPDRPAQRDFLATYLRTTQAVGKGIDRAAFAGPGGVEVWDVAFADLYLEALDADLAGGQGVSRPGLLAFGVAQDLPV